jgi:adenine-specific DNA-methyltransferase
MGRPTSRRLTPATDEPLLPRAERRARGVYYTPPGIVRELVRLTLDPKRTRRASEGVAGRCLHILDPACGAGAMLAEAERQLASRGQGVSLFGVDSDPKAVAMCQDAVAKAVVWTADALFDNRLDRLAPFDAIVGNPPYVNIRQLAKSLPAAGISRLRERYATVRGNFDLYVPFIERAWQLLAPGGCCGLIIPNKWATLDYACPLRELLLAETTIEHVVDLSALRVFTEASVYPHLVIFTKSRPAKSHQVKYQGGGQTATVPQRLLSPAAISFNAPLDVEARVATRPLGQVATISCGTPGYSAQRVAAALANAGGRGSCRAESSEKTLQFITSGNIDRYQITPGNVRFLGKTYTRPVLPLGSPALTDRQRLLFAGQKIVIAGLSQRLEAAWDDRGLALGVQVFALQEFQVDPQFLLALLNSKLLSYLFRTRFAAKCLAGGYLAINKGQLAQLPIVMPREGVGSLWRAMSFNLGATVSAKNSQLRDVPLLSAIDAQIDQFVYRLYRLTTAEIATIEAQFANLGRRAA